MFENIKINSYKEALELIYKTIPSFDDFKKFPGEVGLKRQKLLLKCLGSPQNKIKVIHIAGTSGKGSVVNYLSKLLVGHSFKVGSTVSPHLLDIRERIQINNKLVSESDFVKLAEKVLRCFAMVEEYNLGLPTYFEVLTAMAFLHFHESKVDYAVVETGMGGLLDGTNSIDSKDKISVISRLGLDHTKILGNNILEITKQKAGIIQEENKVLALWQGDEIGKVLKERSALKKAELFYLNKDNSVLNVRESDDGFIYNFSFRNFLLKDLRLNSLAVYQIENSALSLSILKIVSNRDNFLIKKNVIRDVFSKCSFKGRMEVIEGNYKGVKKKIIIDGAHNPQKMNSFLASFNRFKNQEKTFLIAFKEGKDYLKMVKGISKEAFKIFITSFETKTQDLVHSSAKTFEIAEALEKNSFSNYEVVEDFDVALKKSLESKDFIVITGSLYFLSNIYPLLNKVLDK